MVYINSPTHTPLRYRHSPQFRRVFRPQFTARAKDTARHMRDILHLIKEHDSDAVVLFYGDHGAVLSRKLFSAKDMQTPAKKRFYFLDAHAVTAALYPANACAEYMNFNSGYATVAMLVRALIVCLGGGEDPVDWEIDYDAPYADAKFSDFLYE